MPPLSPDEERGAGGGRKRKANRERFVSTAGSDREWANGNGASMAHRVTHEMWANFGNI
jgi:hypothetical protein